MSSLTELLACLHIPHFVGAGHQVAEPNVQSVTELQQAQVGRVTLTSAKVTDFLDVQAGVIGDRILSHTLVLRDHGLNRLRERGMIWTERFGLPFGWHRSAQFSLGHESVRSVIWQPQGSAGSFTDTGGQVLGHI